MSGFTPSDGRAGGLVPSVYLAPSGALNTG
jgi:hypothetical protein